MKSANSSPHNQSQSVKPGDLSFKLVLPPNEGRTMSLWGCQLGSEFLNCAGTLYTARERALLGALAIMLVTAASFVIVRLFNPR